MLQIVEKINQFDLATSSREPQSWAYRGELNLSCLDTHQLDTRHTRLVW